MKNILIVFIFLFSSFFIYGQDLTQDKNNLEKKSIDIKRTISFSNTSISDFNWYSNQKGDTNSFLLPFFDKYLGSAFFYKDKYLGNNKDWNLFVKIDFPFY